MRTAAAFCLVVLAITCPAAAGEVTARETRIDIPTYALGADDKNPPLWNEKVYPYPMQVAIGRERQERSYRAVILENDFLRVIIVPDLGGKLYAAHDKSDADHDFVYHNHVVKPGLVALRGAWTSGGIEWNFPTRGHSVNTFSPVQYALRRNPDGSATCTVGTVEWVRRMQWVVQTTVYPDRSYFHNRVLIANPTLTDNRAYFWANGAVHAWDDTQVIFPPAAYTFAGMRASPEPWPINNGRDVSWYRNTPFPHDFFCGTPGDFEAAYHHQHDCGTVFCAQAGESFGKKFWTWGTARSGKMWDDLLTDRDGSYIEVQSGRLPTQGDTWFFEPHATETFEDFWYPVRNMGGLVKANRDLAVNLRRRGDKLLLALNTTGALDGTVELFKLPSPVPGEGPGVKAFSEKLSLPPAGSWRREIAASTGAEHYRLVVRSAAGVEVIAYDTRPEKVPPPQLEPVLPDADKATVEELYCKGYYAMKHWQLEEGVALMEEALRRDPGFTPALRMLAIVDSKSGLYRQALRRLEKVLARNDDDDQARYYRALAKIALDITDWTEEDLWQASRRMSRRGPALYLLATLAAGRGELARARDLLDEALAANPRDARAAVMRAAILRHQGRKAEAARAADRVLAANPIDGLALIEHFLCAEPTDLRRLAGDPQYYLEAACAYMEMRLFDDARAALELAEHQASVRRHPMVDFYLGYLADRAGDKRAAERRYAAGCASPTDYVFPFRSEDEAVLEKGLRHRRDDWKLHHYLGTLLAARRRWPEGLEHFQRAARSPQAAAVVHRNLGEILWQKLGDRQAAAAAYEKAVARDPNDYTHYVALDTIYAELDEHERRRKLLDEAPAPVRADFRVVLRQAWYWHDVGDQRRALEILAAHTFHPWEGWSGGREVYLRALHARADQAIAEGRFADAVRDLEACMKWPENLGSGEPAEPVYVREYYKLGLCQRGLGHEDRARELFEKAVLAPASELHGGRQSPLKADEEHCRSLAAEQLKSRSRP